MTQARVTTHPETLDDLQHEHAQLKHRLTQLQQHLSLTPEEQYEAMVIKKRKLAIKDRLLIMSAQSLTQDAREASSSWEPQERFELILAMLRQDHTVQQAAQQAGLDPTLVEHWYKQFIQGALEALEQDADA